MIYTLAAAIIWLANFDKYVINTDQFRQSAFGADWTSRAKAEAAFIPKSVDVLISYHAKYVSRVRSGHFGFYHSFRPVYPYNYLFRSITSNWYLPNGSKHLGEIRGIWVFRKNDAPAKPDVSGGCKSCVIKRNGEYGPPIAGPEEDHFRSVKVGAEVLSSGIFGDLGLSGDRFGRASSSLKLSVEPTGLLSGVSPRLFKASPSFFEGLVVRVGAPLRFLPSLGSVEDSQKKTGQTKGVQNRLPDREIDRVFAGDGRPDAGQTALTALAVAFGLALGGGLAGNALASRDAANIRRAKRQKRNRSHKPEG